MAAEQQILRNQFNLKSNTIELLNGSKPLEVGKAYALILPFKTDSGELYRQKDFTIPNTEKEDASRVLRFVDFVPFIKYCTFAVQAIRNVKGTNQYIGSLYLRQADYATQQEISRYTEALKHWTRGIIDVVDRDGNDIETLPILTTLAELTKIKSIGKDSCINSFDNGFTTKEGFTGSCISFNDPLIVRKCTDPAALNYNTVKLIPGETDDCAYEPGSKAHDDATTVNIAGGIYHLLLANTGVYGQYEFWVIHGSMSSPITDLSWDTNLSGSFTETHAGINGPTVTYGPGTHTISVIVSLGDSPSGWDFINNEVQLTIDLVVEANVAGCTDFNAFNYNPNATSDDGSCEAVLRGCMDNGSYSTTTTLVNNQGNNNTSFTITSPVPGTAATNYNSNVNVHDWRSCEYTGCTDPEADNTLVNNPLIVATNVTPCTDNCCEYTEDVNGCTDPGTLAASTYNPSSVYSTYVTPEANIADVNPAYSNFNYNPYATVDDGTCFAKKPGCMDPEASNYSVPIGNPQFDVNWHLQSLCQYEYCADVNANNDVQSADHDVYTMSWTQGNFWDESLATANGLTITPTHDSYLDNNSLCTFDVDVLDICNINSEFDDYGNNIDAGVIGYANTATAGELATTTSGDACLGQLTETASTTVNGFTYNTPTAEKVTLQVIDQDNPVLFLTDPEKYGTLVYTYTGSTGGGANITLPNIDESSATTLAGQLSAAGYNSDLDPSVYFYFRIVDTVENSNTGLTLNPAIDEPVKHQFNNAEIVEVRYSDGAYYYLPSTAPGTVSTFQAGSANTTIPTGYAPGTINGLVLSSTATNAGGGVDCNHATIDEGTAAGQYMYTVYRIKMTAPCSLNAINFLIGYDAEAAYPNLNILADPAFNGETLGCTDPIADNYDEDATYSVSVPMNNWSNYLANGGCFITGCIDEYYSGNLDNNIVVSANTLSGTDIPVQVGQYLEEYDGVIYKIYNSQAYICQLNDYLIANSDPLFDLTAVFDLTYLPNSFDVIPNEWTVPSAEDLISMSTNIASSGSGFLGEFNFTSGEYWSSSLSVSNPNQYGQTYNIVTNPATTVDRANTQKYRIRLHKIIPLADIINGEVDITDCGENEEVIGCTDETATNYNPEATTNINPIAGDTDHVCQYEFTVSDYEDELLPIILNTEGNTFETLEEYEENVDSYFNTIGFTDDLLLALYGDHISGYTSADASIGVTIPALPCVSEIYSGLKNEVYTSGSYDFNYTSHDPRGASSKIQVIGQQLLGSAERNYKVYLNNPTKDGILKSTIDAGAHLSATPSTYLLADENTVISSIYPPSLAEALAQEFNNQGYQGNISLSNLVTYRFRFDKNIVLKDGVTHGDIISYLLNDTFLNTSEAIIKDVKGNPLWPVFDHNDLHKDMATYPSLSVLAGEDRRFHFGFTPNSKFEEYGHYVTNGVNLITSNSNFASNLNDWTVIPGSANSTLAWNASYSGSAQRSLSTDALGNRTGLKRSIAVVSGNKYKITYTRAVVNVEAGQTQATKTYVEVQTAGNNIGEFTEIAVQNETSPNLVTTSDTFTYTGLGSTVDLYFYFDSQVQGFLSSFEVEKVIPYPNGYVYSEDPCDDTKVPSAFVYDVVLDISNGLGELDFSPYVEYVDPENTGCMDATALNYDEDATFTNGNLADCLYYLDNCAGTGVDIEVDVESADEGCGREITVKVTACDNVVSNATISIIVLQKITDNTGVSPITSFEPIFTIGDIEPCIDGVSNTDGVAILAGFTYDPTTTQLFAGANAESNVTYITGQTAGAIPINTYHPEFQIQYSEFYLDPESGETEEYLFDYNPATDFQSVNFTIDPIINGCTNDSSFNYNSNATCDDGTCVEVAEGCTDVAAFNYDPLANTDEGCIPVIEGCTDIEAYNTNYTTDEVASTSPAGSNYLYGDIQNLPALPDVGNLSINTPGNEDLCFYCTQLQVSDQGEHIAQEITTLPISPDLVTTKQITFTWNSTINVDNQDVTLADSDGNPVEVQVKYTYTNYAYTFVPDFVMLYLQNPPCKTSTGFTITTESVSYSDLRLGVTKDLYIINTDNSTYGQLTKIEFVAYYNTGDNGVSRCAQTISTEVDYIDPIMGCFDSNAFNYYLNNNYTASSSYNFPSEVCAAASVPIAQPTLTIPDFCYPIITGCTNSEASNYTQPSGSVQSNVNTESECEFDGCTQEWADNYSSIATDDDDSCYKEGCTRAWADNYDVLATIDDGSCFATACTQPNVYTSHFCLDDTDPCFSTAANNDNGISTNYTADTALISDDTLCLYAGCTDNGEINSFSSQSIVSDHYADLTWINNFLVANNLTSYVTTLLTEIPAFETTPQDPGQPAANYNSLATVSADTCSYEGCTDSIASNYDADATTDDGSCTYFACIEEGAANFGEGITSGTTADTIDLSLAANECEGPNLLSTNRFKLNEYWAEVNATEGDSEDYTFTSASTYTSGVLTKTIISPFSPNDNPYSILEPVFDGGFTPQAANGVDINTTIQYPTYNQVDTGSNDYIYRYILRVTISRTNINDSTDLSDYEIKIKEYSVSNSLDPNNLTAAQVTSLETQNVTLLQTVTLASVGDNVYETTDGYIPHQFGQVTVVEISGGGANSVSTITDMTLTRDLCIDPLLNLDSPEMEALNNQEIYINSVNVDFYSELGESLITDGNFEAMLGNIVDGYTEGTLIQQNWADSAEVLPGISNWLTLHGNMTGSDWFNPTSIESWDRDYYGLYQQAILNVNADPNHHGAILMSAPNDANDTFKPNVHISQAVTYTIGKIYKLTFTAALVKNTGTTNTTLSVHTNVTYDSTAGVQTTVTNTSLVATQEITEVLTEHTRYFTATAEMNGLSFSIPGNSTSVRVLFISVAEATPNLFNSNTDRCYLFGCNEPWATNYNPDFGNEDYFINVPAGELGPQGEAGCFLEGCMNSLAGNYDPNATIDDGSCIKYGCTDNGYAPNNTLSPYPLGQEADNYDPTATINETSADDLTSPCLYTGCMELTINGVVQQNYNAAYNVSGNCYSEQIGCMDTQYWNYNDTDGDGTYNNLTGIEGQDINEQSDPNTCCLNLYGSPNEAGNAIVATVPQPLTPPKDTYNPIQFSLNTYDCAGNDASVFVGPAQLNGVSYGTLPSFSDSTVQVNNIIVRAYPATGTAGSYQPDLSSTLFTEHTPTWEQLTAVNGSEIGIEVPIYDVGTTTLATFIIITFNYTNVAQSTESENSGYSCTYSSSLIFDNACLSTQGCLDNGYLPSNASQTPGFPTVGFNPSSSIHVDSTANCNVPYVLGCMDQYYAKSAGTGQSLLGTSSAPAITGTLSFNYNNNPSGNDIRGVAYDGWSTAATINMFDNTNSANINPGALIAEFHPLYDESTAATENQDPNVGTGPAEESFNGAYYGCFPVVTGCLTTGKFNKNNFYHAGNIHPQTGAAYSATPGDPGNIAGLTFGANEPQDPTINPLTLVPYTAEQIRQNFPYFFNVNTQSTDAATNCYNSIAGCTDPTAANFVALTNNVDVDVNTDNGSCCYDAADITGLTAALTTNFYSTLYQGADVTLLNGQYYNDELTESTLDFTHASWSNITYPSDGSTMLAAVNATTLTSSTYTGDAIIWRLDSSAGGSALTTADNSIINLTDLKLVLTSTQKFNVKVVALNKDFVINSIASRAAFVESLENPNNNISRLISSQNYELGALNLNFDSSNDLSIGTLYKDLVLIITHINEDSVNSSTISFSKFKISKRTYAALTISAGLTNLIDNLSNFPSTLSGYTATVKNSLGATISTVTANTAVQYLGVMLPIYKYDSSAANANAYGAYAPTYSNLSTHSNATNFVDPNLGTQLHFSLSYLAADGSTVCTASTGIEFTIPIDFTNTSINYGCSNNTYLQYYLNNYLGNTSAITNYTHNAGIGAAVTIPNGDCQNTASTGCTDDNYLGAYPDKEQIGTVSLDANNEISQITTPFIPNQFGYLGAAGFNSPTYTGSSFPNVAINISNNLQCGDEIIFGCLIDTFAEYWGATTISGSHTLYGVNEGQGNFTGEAGTSNLSFANVSQVHNVPGYADHALLEGCGDATVAVIGCATETQSVTAVVPDSGTTTGGSAGTSVVGVTSNVIFTSTTTTSNVSYGTYDSNVNVIGLSACGGFGGCTDDGYLEYYSTPAANVSDSEVVIPISECETLVIVGCTDSSYTGYNPEATIHDGVSCGTPILDGCTDPSFCEYYTEAQTLYNVHTGETAIVYPNNDIGTCKSVQGCMNPNYLEAYGENYNSALLASINEYEITGPQVSECNSLTGQYSLDEYAAANPELAQTQINDNYYNEGCSIPIVIGCTDPTAVNYNVLANVSSINSEGVVNASCISKTEGCTDSTAFNYDPEATFDDGSCITLVEGCTNNTAFNFNSDANTNDGSCIPFIYGCIESTFTLNNTTYTTAATSLEAEYDPITNPDITAANTHSPALCFPEILGCTDETAVNFNNYISATPDIGQAFVTDLNAAFTNVNTDNGSCLASVVGCMDPCANNYEASATVSGSCTYTPGCTDTSAINYNPEANQLDTTCTYCEDWSLVRAESSYVTVVDNTYFINNVSSSDGSITINPVSANGVTNNYVIKWTGIATDGSIVDIADNTTTVTGLAPGEYTFTIYTDNPACAPSPTDPVSNVVTTYIHQTDLSCTYDTGDTESYSTLPLAISSTVTVGTDNYGCTDNEGYDPGFYNPVGELTIHPLGGLNNTYTSSTDEIQLPTNTAINYDGAAGIDDGSCNYAGCTDPDALNYDSLATVNDNSCQYIVGCTIVSACNYHPAAVLSGPCEYAAVFRNCLGECVHPDTGATLATADNPLGESLENPGLCPNQVLGICLDPTAINFTPIGDNIII